MRMSRRSHVSEGVRSVDGRVPVILYREFVERGVRTRGASLALMKNFHFRSPRSAFDSTSFLTQLNSPISSSKT